MEPIIKIPNPKNLNRIKRDMDINRTGVSKILRHKANRRPKDKRNSWKSDWV